jgi:Flp pilus assembly protein TadG
VIRRRWPGRDRGSFTAEFAAGLPALTLMLLVGLTAVTAVSTRLQCLDAAREGAIAAARGDSGPAAAARAAPPGADVSISVGTDTATATVGSRVRMLGGHLPLLTVRATAVAAREPEASGPIP